MSSTDPIIIPPKSTTNDSSNLIAEALNANESTLLMQCALLQKILEAKSGEAVSATQPKKPPVPTPASGVAAVDSGDGTLNPAQQGMVLLGDLAYLDMLGQELFSAGLPPPADLLKKFTDMAAKVNALIASAPKGSIDPAVLAVATDVLSKTGTNDYTSFVSAYDSDLNDIPGTANETIADWILNNTDSLMVTNSSNLDLASSIAIFMVDIQDHLDNWSTTPYQPPNWDPSFQKLLPFFSTISGGTRPEPASQATADLLIYFFWVQNGSPQKGSSGWTDFQADLSNFMNLANPTNWNTSGGGTIDPGYAPFFADLEADVSSWNTNGPPTYGPIFVTHLFTAWNTFLNNLNNQ